MHAGLWPQSCLGQKQTSWEYTKWCEETLEISYWRPRADREPRGTAGRRAERSGDRRAEARHWAAPERGATTAAGQETGLGGGKEDRHRAEGILNENKNTTHQNRGAATKAVTSGRKTDLKSRA